MKREFRMALFMIALLGFPAAWSVAQSPAFFHPTEDIGASVIASFGGTIDTDFGELTKETGVVFHAFGDFYLIDKLAMGIYGNIGPSLSIAESDETATWYEIGASIKPRFVIRGGAVAIKPGLEIGYRGVTGKVFTKDIRGFAVNGSVEVQINAHSSVIPFIVLGIFSQPAGGDGETNVTFAPLFYAGAGVAF
jgi:hypothetical protein